MRVRLVAVALSFSVIISAFVFAWNLRLSQLPKWQRSIETELAIGRFSHAVSYECCKNILAEYALLKFKGCEEKLAFFEYLTFNYLLPITGDAHGRETVAEMILADACAAKYIAKMRDKLKSDQLSESDSKALNSMLLMFEKEVQE